MMQARSLPPFGRWRQRQGNRLRQRFRVWIMRKRPREKGTVTLHRRRIYIIPTRLGAAFGILLFCMLLGAMNYANSMAFALTFLLTGVALVAMHHTHRNLLNLQLSAGHCDPVFAGQWINFQIVLHNPTPRNKIAIAVNWIDHPPQGYVDIPSGERRLFRLPLRSHKRGHLPAGRFTAHTRYPLGLFYAWNYIELDMQGLVYPVPEEGRSQPPPARGEGRGQRHELAGQEDYAGLRPYQRHDSPRLIHWKAFPRSQQLVVKQFADPMADSLWLDWDSLPGMEHEQRISRLCRWILDAHRAGRSYGLRLPQLALPPACDEAHRHRCLEALALLES